MASTIAPGPPTLALSGAAPQGVVTGPGSQGGGASVRRWLLSLRIVRGLKPNPQNDFSLAIADPPLYPTELLCRAAAPSPVAEGILWLRSLSAGAT